MKRLPRLLTVFLIILPALYSQENTDLFASMKPWQKSGIILMLNKALKVDPLSQYRFFSGIQHSMNDYNPGFFKRKMGREWRAIVQSDKDTVSVYPFSQRLSFSANLTAIASSLPNFDIKGHIFQENRFGKFFPQITVGINTWFTRWSLANTYFKSLNKNKTMTDLSLEFDFGDECSAFTVSPYIIFSKSLSPDTKIFGGYRASGGRAVMKIFEPSPAPGTGPYNVLRNMLGTNKSIPLNSHEIFFGTTVQFKRSDLEGVLYSGLYMTRMEQRFADGSQATDANGDPKTDISDVEMYMKTELSGRLFVFGIGFYPVNFFRVKPYLRIRINY